MEQTDQIDFVKTETNPIIEENSIIQTKFIIESDISPDVRSAKKLSYDCICRHRATNLEKFRFLDSQLSLSHPQWLIPADS